MIQIQITKRFLIKILILDIGIYLDFGAWKAWNFRIILHKSQKRYTMEARVFLAFIKHINTYPNGQLNPKTLPLFQNRPNHQGFGFNLGGEKSA